MSVRSLTPSATWKSRDSDDGDVKRPTLENQATDETHSGQFGSGDSAAHAGSLTVNVQPLMELLSAEIVP